jgi:hypothetical protein
MSSQQITDKYLIENKIREVINSTLITFNISNKPNYVSTLTANLLAELNPAIDQLVEGDKQEKLKIDHRAID